MNAAAYCRYSTAHQTENSIEYQLAKISAFCMDRDISITAIFTDEAKSGTNTDRPGFQAMVEAAKRREFAAVIVYDISRGSRDVGDWFTFRKTMFSLGVQVISATQTLGDMANGDDFLVELLSVGLGHREVLETRSKSMAGVDVRAKEGAFLGGVPPLGYDVRGGAYVVNPMEAEAVRTIFRLYADGASYNAILDAVQGEVVGKRGRPLGKNSLHSILTNERYRGTYTWCSREVKRFGKWAGGGASSRAVRIEGAVPAIVDAETWERVRERMADRKRNPANSAKRDFLLSGLITCENCGATFVGRTSRNSKGYETIYYVCGNKYRTRTCKARNIKAAPLEAFVVRELKAWLARADIAGEAARIAEKVNAASGPDLRAERAELSQVEAKITRGVRALLDGWDGVEELREEVARLRARKAELERRISEAGAARRTVTAEEVEAILRRGLDDLGGNPRRAVREYVQKIIAHTDGTISVHVGVPLIGCGGPQPIIYTTIFALAAAKNSPCG